MGCGELFTPLDGRPIKVIVDGLSLDSTVAHLHGDGTARRHAATTSGVALQAARRAKETTFLELSGEGGRARLVVLAAKVGRRWSQETADFLSTRIPTALTGQGQNHVRQALERNFGVLGQVIFVVLVGRRHPFCA